MYVRVDVCLMFVRFECVLQCDCVLDSCIYSYCCLRVECAVHVCSVALIVVCLRFV